MCAPALEAAGLRAGVDFHLAFSPERVDPGNAEWTVATTPKVVGGLTRECGRRAALVLESLMRTPAVCQVSTPAAAEMAKLLENTYRAVNIALVNELAQLCHRMGIDVWEVIDAAATKPFGFEAFRPGIGPGGHCIPVDPQYLSWKAREFDFRTEFIDLAADTNQGMADYVLGRIRACAVQIGGRAPGARGFACVDLGIVEEHQIPILGNSAIRVMELLVQAGRAPSFADPLVDELEVSSERHKAVATARDGRGLRSRRRPGRPLAVGRVRAARHGACVRRCRGDQLEPSGVRAARRPAWSAGGPGPSSIPCSSSSRSPLPHARARARRLRLPRRRCSPMTYFQRLARWRTASLPNGPTTTRDLPADGDVPPVDGLAWLGSAVLPAS